MKKSHENQFSGPAGSYEGLDSQVPGNGEGIDYTITMWESCCCGRPNPTELGCHCTRDPENTVDCCCSS